MVDMENVIIQISQICMDRVHATVYMHACTHTTLHTYTPSTTVRFEKSSTNKLADSPAWAALYGVTVKVKLVTVDNTAKWNTVPVVLKLSDSAKLFIPATVS